MSTFKKDLRIGRRVPLIEGADFANGSIKTSKIDDKAVTTEKLADKSVTEPKLADKAVTAQKLADGAVTNAKIKDGTIENAKLAGNIPGEKIKDNTIDAREKVVNGSISGEKIKDKSIGGDKFAKDFQITNDMIAPESLYQVEQVVNEAKEAAKYAYKEGDKAQEAADDIQRAENARVEAENARQASYDVHNQNEGQRQMREAQRNAAEEGRVEAENARQQAENARQHAFNENEAARQMMFDNKEQQRAAAEERRVEAENARQQAENARQQTFEAAEAEREAASDSAHTVFSDDWDADDEAEGWVDPINTESSYAYNWKTTDEAASDGKTQGNLKDLYEDNLRIKKDQVTVKEMKEMIGKLPDGSAVSAQVAENTGEIAKISQQVGKIEQERVTVKEIEEVMLNLPDGSAVSAQVAVNAGKLSELESGKANRSDTVEILNRHEEEQILDVCDEKGFILARLSEGEIETKNFKSKQTPICESTPNNNNFSICDVNENHIVAFKGGHIRTQKFDSSVGRGDYQRIIRFTYDVDCSLILHENFAIANDINSCMTKKIYTDNAVLYLPESYSPYEKATKLIIYCKHGASEIKSNSDPIMGSLDSNVFRYLLSLGYAILGADGVPDSFAQEIGICERVVGNYIAVQSIRKAYDYVVSKYNIDKTGAYIYGYSQGGHYAQNVIDLSGINIIAAAQVSPVCSMRYHQWDLNASGTIGGVSWTKLARLNVARLFGFDVVTSNDELLALQFDKNKIQGYDPWTRNVENPYDGFTQTSSVAKNLWALPAGTKLEDIQMKKYLKCPLKVWCAENDNSLGVDVMKVFVQAAKNAGCVADMQLYSTGAHKIQSSQTSIGTFVENSETCQLFPLAYEIAMWFGKFGGIMKY